MVNDLNYDIADAGGNGWIMKDRYVAVAKDMDASPVSTPDFKWIPVSPLLVGTASEGLRFPEFTNQ